MKPYLATALKAELRSATLDLCATLKADRKAPDLSALFYVFDGGNGNFYIHASHGDPKSLKWQAVLDEDLAQRGTFAQVKAVLADIDAGKVSAADLDEGRAATLENGRTRKIGFGDEALNAFLIALLGEVLKEAEVRAALRAIRHPGGCTVFASDDEVLGHKRYTRFKLPK